MPQFNRFVFVATLAVSFLFISGAFAQSEPHPCGGVIVDVEVETRPGCVTIDRVDMLSGMFDVFDDIDEHALAITRVRGEMTTQRDELQRQLERAEGSLRDEFQAEIDRLDGRIGELDGMAERLTDLEADVDANRLGFEAVVNLLETRYNPAILELERDAEDLRETVAALGQRLQAQLDDHETRIAALESSAPVRPTFGLGFFGAQGVDPTGIMQVGLDTTLGGSMRFLAVFHFGTDGEHPAIGGYGGVQYEFDRLAVGAGVTYNRDLGDNETNVQSQGIIAGPSVEYYLNEGRNVSAFAHAGVAVNSEQVDEDYDRETTGFGGTFGVRLRFP